MKGGAQMGGRTSDETVRGDASLWAGILLSGSRGL